MLHLQATLELRSTLSTADTLSVKDSWGDGSSQGGGAGGSQLGAGLPRHAASKYVMWKGKRLCATQKTGEKLLHKAARMGYEVMAATFVATNEISEGCFFCHDPTMSVTVQ